MYPTTENLLQHLQEIDATFPIQSKASLWRWIKRLGFEYKTTSKIVIPLDSLSVMAQRSKCFTKWNEIRSNGSIIYYHDESWTNSGEEKTKLHGLIPIPRSGQLRNNDTKGNKNS